MASKKGLKLHSIIEKLSEQCVRDNPSEDFSTKHTTITAHPSKQRNNRGNGKGKRPKKTLVSKATNTDNMGATNIYSKLGASKDKAKDSCQQVDDDLCIDVDALMSISPQVQDIDIANVAEKCFPFEHGCCSICLQTVKSKKELLSHLKDYHPEHFKKIPLINHNTEEDNPAESSIDNEQDDEEEFEEVEESDESNHTDSDPDFALDMDSDTDVSSDDMIMPTVKHKRRSRRIKARIGTGTESDESEEIESYSNNNLEENDIYIDVEKFQNTSPKLEDIDLPKTKHFACKFCKEKYYFSMELEEHLIASHPESAHKCSQTTWKCEHCNNEFLSKEDLFLHLTQIVQKIEEKKRIQEEKQKKKEKENTCRHCGKMCKSNGSLKKHYLTHSDDRPFKCDICNRTFKDKNYVYRHKKTHSGIKKYECSYCKKLFAHSGSLRTHIMLHTGERPYKCQLCEAGFISKFDLKVHDNKHTGNMPYKCPLCTKSFPKSNNLKVHLIAHSTDKPFPCEVCGKAFKRRDHLRYHLIIHSDDKPYKCDTCNKKFNQHICLRKHLPCRELEKLERRANKPKENSSHKQQKVSKKSHRNKQVSDFGTITAMSTKETTSLGENTCSNEQFAAREDDAASELSLTYINADSSTTTSQEKSKKAETNQSSIQIDAVNTELLSSNMVNSLTSSKEKVYSEESHASLPSSDNLDPILNSTRQSNDSGLSLSSLVDGGSTSATMQHCSIDRIDFSEFRVPNQGNVTSSIRTFPHSQRLTETCVYTPSIQQQTCVYTPNIQQPFVPFNCSSQSASDLDYEAGGLELETLQSDSTHGNILGGRSFPHGSPNEISSVLLEAMDPDNLSAIADSASAFFSPT